MDGRGRFRKGAFVAVATAAILAALAPPLTRAASDKVLQRVRGSIGYQTAASAPLRTVIGKFLMPDDYFAVTHAQSAALLTLPDSSIVALGENTDVQVGAFNETAAGPGSTVTVSNGTLRFDIRRPHGGTANYRFVTATSQVAVRGTVGLLSFIDGNTTVACLACATDSVTVTVGTQTFTVVTGQVLTVSAAGAVVPAPLTGTALGAFSTAEVSTSVATGPKAATAGVVPATSGAAPGALAAAAVGAGVVSGVAIAANQNGSPAPQTTANPNVTVTPTPTHTPSPTPTPTPTPTQNPTPTPVPTPTVTTSANVSITQNARVTVSPGVAAPSPAPPELRPIGRRP